MRHVMAVTSGLLEHVYEELEERREEGKGG